MTNINTNEKGEVTNFQEFLTDAASKLSQDVDDGGQIVIYTGYYKWNDGTIHKEPEIPDALVETAKKVAHLHKDDEPEIIVFWYPHPNEIRLLEMSPMMPGCGEVHPFRFGRDNEIGFPVCIIALNEKEWDMLQRGELKLPDGWNQEPIRLV